MRAPVIGFVGIGDVDELGYGEVAERARAHIAATLRSAESRLGDFKTGNIFDE